MPNLIKQIKFKSELKSKIKGKFEVFNNEVYVDLDLLSFDRIYKYFHHHDIKSNKKVQKIVE